MKDYETLISDIRREEMELNEKLGRLERFMMTEDFCTLSAEQQKLLNRQQVCMTEYKSILMQRSYRINFEHAQDKEKTCAPEPEKEERVEPHVIDAIRYKIDRQKKAKEEETELACNSCKWGGSYHENGQLVYTCHNKDAKAIRDHKCYSPKENK